MKKLLLTAVAFTAVVLPAMAADLAPVYKAPPPPPPPSWTGFYLGGTVGGIFTNNSVDVTTTNTANNISGNLSALGLTAGPASAAAATSSVGAGWSSLAGGAELGYNWQVAPTLLLGLEADIQGIADPGGPSALSNVVARDAVRFPGFNYAATISATDKVNWLGTARGRLGFLVTPTWLVYGTGGLAYGDVSSSTAITGGETPNTGATNIAGAGSLSSTRVGWTVGAGAEYMFLPNWTVKAEWLHYDLGSASYSNGTMTSFAGGVPAFTDVASSTVKFSGDIVRGGINYKF
ncbi:MAG TPA: outer membrane beta-barrel protein [Xanthobacteraceae bacterium]|jgi:outer membrane immunogenic protein|nr:outer membrane beta-barrel protein [Xanthobacteraceae bacterium]